MRELVLLCINQHTKFEVHSFISSKDMIGTKFKKAHVTLTMSVWGVSSLSSKAKHLIYSTCIQNFATLTLTILEI